jgi:hypothetical protein
VNESPGRESGSDGRTTPQPAPSGRRDAALLLLLYSALALAGPVLLLNSVNDPDFFWHLKTGEWIWEHRGLPVSDPFNFMNQASAGEGQRFTLTAYWLTQVIYHLVHEALGMPGIAALKLVVFSLFLAALLKLRRGDRVLHAALVLSVLPLLAVGYAYDRPQAFSFLFFALLLAILERARSVPGGPAGWRSDLAAPLLMLLWANMHGGHVLGQAVIVLFLVLEGVKFSHPSLQPLGPERYRRLAVAGGGALLVSLVNPNSWHGFAAAVSPVPVWLGNEEYASTLSAFRMQPLVAVFWGALGLSLLSVLRSWRKPDITRIVLLAALGYQGSLHVRYVPFFLVAALPAVGAWLSAERLVPGARHLVAAGSLALATLPLRDAVPTRERVAVALRVNERVYPVHAADFVLANAPRGNLYNTYLWGGYLLWRLSPERKVFVDGRGLSPYAVFQGFTISTAFRDAGDPPLWERLLRQYGVGYIVIPRVESSGGIGLDRAGPLRAALSTSPGWALVFSDPISLVFVRNVPEHRALIARHAIHGERFRGGDP